MPDGYHTCILSKGLYVLDLNFNLLSISEIRKKGKTSTFTDASCKIFNKSNKLLAVCNRVGKLYNLNLHESETVKACSNVANKSDDYLWHRRFYHLGFNNLQKW